MKYPDSVLAAFFNPAHHGLLTGEDVKVSVAGDRESRELLTLYCQMVEHRILKVRYKVIGDPFMVALAELFSSRLEEAQTYSLDLENLAQELHLPKNKRYLLIYFETLLNLLR